MIPNFREVFIMTEQPTTCPDCGNRTEILMDFWHTFHKLQVHKCLSNSCKFEFVEIFDEDIICDYEKGAKIMDSE